MNDSFTVSSKGGSYSVEFDSFRNILKGIPSDSLVIADKKVVELFKIDENVPQERLLQVEASERLKSFPSGVEEILSFLTESHATRETLVVALGGGIIQDVVGFATSVYFRGLKWLYFPTTLLAMSDSCVGAKTSINFGSRKNQLGTYHSPSRIVIDTAFVKTLEKVDVLGGLAEALKIHICDNKENVAVNYLGAGEWNLDEIDYDGIISSSLLIKKEFIEEDEFDNGRRQYLNYGHTFGHAMEALSRYRLSHGFAVALGMHIASYFAFRTSRISQSEFNSVHDMIRLNYEFSEMLGEGDVHHIVEAMKADKKCKNGVMHFVLKDKDAMDLVPFENLNQVEELLADYFKNYNITE